MLLCSCVIVRGGVCVCEWNLRMNGRAYKISFHIESIRMNFLFSSDEIISCCFTCSARWIGYPCCKWRVSRSIIWKLWTRDQMNEGFLGSCAAAAIVTVVTLSTIIRALHFVARREWANIFRVSFNFVCRANEWAWSILFVVVVFVQCYYIILI